MLLHASRPFPCRSALSKKQALRSLHRATLLASLLVFAQPASVHAIALSPEREITSVTVSFGTGFSGHRVAAASDGTYLVVWRGAISLGVNAVYARRLDVDAVPIGPSFQVSPTSALSVREPAVAIDSTGDAIVVWSRAGDLYAQRLDAAGSLVGGEILISNDAAQEVGPRIAVQTDGDYTVAYYHFTTGGIWARHFDATDTPIGPAFQVNTTTTGTHRNPDLAMAADDTAVVVWSQSDTGTILAQRYGANGNAVGSEIVASSEADFLSQPAVGKGSGGEFVLQWKGLVGVGCCEIWIRRYDSGGNPLGAAFIASGASFDVEEHSLVVHPSGAFLSTWSRQDANEAWWIDVRSFDASGSPLEPAPQEIQQDSAIVQTHPFVASGLNERVVVAWRKGTLGAIVRRRSVNINLPSIGALGLLGLIGITGAVGIRSLRIGRIDRVSGERQIQRHRYTRRRSRLPGAR